MLSEMITPLVQRLESLEEEITSLEERQKILEKSMADPEVLKDEEKTVPLMKEYHTVQKKQEMLLQEWEQCQGELTKKKSMLKEEG